MADEREDDDEAALVARSRGGDRAAFERLVRDTARWLFVRVYLQVGGGDRHRCEDLVQETYLRAWRSLPTLSDGTRFRPWLASIAHAAVIDAAKHDSRKKRGGGESKRDDGMALMRLADQKPAPPESLERDEQRRRVLGVLRDLPDEYRDVLTLRYLAGADYETISKQLAITNGSLRGLLSRGMRMLRERLDLSLPSSGTPGEGQGGGPTEGAQTSPHPNPPPEYRRRGNADDETTS